MDVVLRIGHTATVWDVAWDPTGELLGVAASLQPSVWHVRSSERVCEAEIESHGSYVNAVAFSPAGGRRLVATGSDDGVVRVTDLDVRRKVGDTAVALGNGDGVAVNALAFSPCGTMLAAGCADFLIRLFTLEESQGGDSGSLSLRCSHATLALPCHYAAISHVAFSPSGATLATTASDGYVKIWDVATRKLVSASKLFHDTTGITAVAFEPRHGRVIATLATHYAVEDEVHGRLGASAVAVPSGGRTAPCCCLRDADTLEFVRWVGESLALYEIWTVSFDKTGAVLAIGGQVCESLPAAGPRPSVVALCHVSTGAALRVVPYEHPSYVTCLAFQTAGCLLAVGGSDRAVRVWDVPELGMWSKDAHVRLGRDARDAAFCADVQRRGFVSVREFVTAVFAVEQRLRERGGRGARSPPPLPHEMWLLVLSCLRLVDMLPAAVVG